MSDERRYWRFRKGSSNAAGGVSAADRMALKRLHGNTTPVLPAFLASLSGSLGLLLGALAVAAIAGLRLLRRRARQHQRLHQVLSQDGDDNALLSACATGAVQQSPYLVHLKLQQRARLESLLQTALDDQNAPLDFRPLRLAHQMGNGGQWTANEVTHPLFSPADAWTESEASPASPGALGSRRWGLASHSLQLTPGAIQVSASMYARCLHMQLARCEQLASDADYRCSGILLERLK